MYVYIVRCMDDSYYTGVTNNIDRRVSEHNMGTDPRNYTYSRRPVFLVFFQAFEDPRQAIMAEKQIKGWRREKKEALIAEDYDLLVRLSNKK
ncbi:MAG: GIY-YIG nuclease family protein [Candidatus Cloacimonadaceae bacterium]